MWENLATTSATIGAEMAVSGGTNLLNTFDTYLMSNPNAAAIFFLLVNVWVLLWKGLALWKAAKLKQKGWFVLILLLNTMGLLEIAYLLVISKINWSRLAKKFGITLKPKIVTQERKNSI